MKMFKKNDGATIAAGATDMLREDHRKVKELFEEFERTDEVGAKRKLLEASLIELTIHATIEEEIFYPAARKQIDDQELLDEAAEEHHVAKVLIGELSSMKPSDERYDAKFMVLAESVRHHIEEEEGEMFPKLERSGFDLETIGQEMSERKSELMNAIDLAAVRRQFGREARSTGSPSGGRRSSRSSRGTKSRRVSSRGRSAKSRA